MRVEAEARDINVRDGEQLRRETGAHFQGIENTAEALATR
jgi:hypothetical protein